MTSVAIALDGIVLLVVVMAGVGCLFSTLLYYLFA